MITDTLLTSPDFIKSMTNISDNLNGKVMQAAIREAQEIDLKEIIGTVMLKKLKTLVADGTIENEENENYLDLLNECQYFLAYTVIAKLCIITSYKIDNAGVVKTSDERVENASEEEIYNIQEFYQRKADYWISQLQAFILNHLGVLPEITETQCREIHATLYSAANTTIFLGGARGKGYGWRMYPYRYMPGMNLPGMVRK